MKYLFFFLVVCAGVAHAAVCDAAYEPHTINATWTQIACNAISAGGGEVLCGDSSTCTQKTIAFAEDVAVNANDTLIYFCDGDGSETSMDRIAVADNALGSGTVDTVNSGGNTTVTKSTGSTFTSGWVGGYIMIDAALYPIIGFTDGSHITVSGNAGSHTGFTYVAGNGYTKLPQTNFDFLNGTRHVIGNEFYLLGATVTAASGYAASCQVHQSTGTVFDMDVSVSLFRQGSGGASAGLDDSSVWTNGVSAGGTCNQGPNNNGCLQATTPSITRSVPNDLVFGVAQQNNAPAGMSFSSGTFVACDNDPPTSTLPYWYTGCSDTTATGTITMSSYGDGANVEFANAIFALKAASTTGLNILINGGIAVRGGTAIK